MKSIQSRLTLWLVSSVLALFSLHWLVTSRAPVRMTLDYVATRLQHDGDMLLPGVSFDVLGRPVIDAHSFAPIYAHPGSGHYFIIETDEHRLRSQSLGKDDISIPWPPPGEHDLLHLEGPNNEPLLVWAETKVHRGHRVRIAIAEELTRLNHLLGKFRTRFTAVTLLLLTVLIAAQHFIVRNSLRPLQKIARDCRKLECGSIDSLPENVPSEIRPLVREVNRLARLMRERLQRSRNAVGNLAHSLKTPLTLLDQLLQGKQRTLTAGELEQARDSTAMISSLIDRELKRARLAGAVSSTQTFDMRPEVQSIIDLLKKVYEDKTLHYSMIIRNGAITYGDREDMLELIGNLMENASKWARHEVRFTAGLNDHLKISVEDDGPGIAPELRDNLTQRGVRADESRGGHGLGLSIVKDIVKQYNGDITFTSSGDLGGLCVDIRLPTATICRD